MIREKALKAVLVLVGLLLYGRNLPADHGFMENECVGLRRRHDAQHLCHAGHFPADGRFRKPVGASQPDRFRGWSSFGTALFMARPGSPQWERTHRPADCRGGAGVPSV